MTRANPGTPRWRLLLALSAVVLAAHLWLLTGGLPRWRTDTTEVAPVAGPVAVVQTRTVDGARHSPDTPLAPRVSASTVRWIVPTRPGKTPAPPPPKPRPKPPAASAAVGPAMTPPSEPLRSDPAVTAAPPAPTEASSPPPANAPAPTTVAQAETSPPAQNDPTGASTPPASPGADGGPALPNARPPGGIDLPYDVTGTSKGISYSAEARLSWQPSGTRYSAELKISAFLLGSRVQTSSGRLEAHGLVPERFGDRRRSNEKAAHFDHAGRRIRYSNNAPDTPLLPGAQDRLSVFLQLAALMQARPDAYPAGQSIRLQVAGTGDAEVWPFQVGPEETLDLPGGRVSARRLTRPPRHEHDSTVDIWLAPSLQHLPVRIRVTEPNGDVADQQLRQLPPTAP